MNRIVTSLPRYETCAASPSTTRMTSAVRRAGFGDGSSGLGRATTVSVEVIVAVGMEHATGMNDSDSSSTRGARTSGASHVALTFQTTLKRDTLARHDGPGVHLRRH